MRAIDWAGRPADWNPPPPGSRPRPDCRRVLEEVRRLELRALAHMEGDLMDTAIDAEKVEKIKELGQQGLSIAEIAAQAGCGRTTVRKYLGRNSHVAASAEATDGNRHSPDRGAGLEELTAFLDARWRSLSLLERVRFLLRD